MTMLAIHNCRRCGGTLNAEHYAELPTVWPSGAVSLLVMEYCEYCELGWDTVYDVIDEVRHLNSFLQYDPRHKPVDFGKFLQRLKDEVEVAA